MDPLSITTGCLSLLGAVGKTTIAITTFLRSYREARTDLADVNLELSGLALLLELLKEDSAISDATVIPESLHTQILSIITNCTAVVSRINHVLEGYTESTASSVKWAAFGKGEIAGLRMSLEAHRASLNLALDFVSVSITASIKEDTGAIRDDLLEIKQDTSQIPQMMEELERLRAIVARSARTEHSSDNYMLQQYLDGLTSYAETVWHESDRCSLNMSSARSSLDLQRLNLTEEVNEPAPGLPPLVHSQRISRETVPHNIETKDTENRAWTSGQKVGVILYDFMAQGDYEVTVAVGDDVIILDDPKNGEWWQVRRIKNGKEGIVPSSYIEPKDVNQHSSKPEEEELVEGRVDALKDCTHTLNIPNPSPPKYHIHPVKITTPRNVSPDKTIRDSHSEPKVRKRLVAVGDSAVGKTPLLVYETSCIRPKQMLTPLQRIFERSVPRNIYPDRLRELCSRCRGG